MNKVWTLFGASLLMAALIGGPLRASGREVATVESAAEVLQALANLPLKGIPPALLNDAQGVAIIPNVFKASFVFGGRFGRGVILTREADGSWSNPVFLTLAGGGVGWQAGIQSTDVILVFKTRGGLDRVLQGKSKLTLGADLAVAAGPVGRQATAATDAMLRAEIYSYSRSRGLFLGLSLEGAGLLMDYGANEVFYRLPGGHPSDILTPRGVAVPMPAEALKAQLARLSSPVLIPPPIVPVPLSPPSPAMPGPPPPAPLPGMPIPQPR